MENIWEFVRCADIEDVKETLDKQIECNMKIAREGIRGNYGANIGSILLKMEGDSVQVRAKAMAAAGSDARTAGRDQFRKRQSRHYLFCSGIGLWRKSEL